MVEKAVGIMANRFRVFHTRIALEPAKVETIVMAARMLHNMLREEVRFTSNLCDQEDPATCKCTTRISGAGRYESIQDNIIVVQ